MEREGVYICTPDSSSLPNQQHCVKVLAQNYKLVYVFYCNYNWECEIDKVGGEEGHWLCSEVDVVKSESFLK